jgi:soluble lytic murein transglycosylase-like protein
MVDVMLRCAFLIGLVAAALAMHGAAWADVMEVGNDGAHWVAGGPAPRASAGRRIIPAAFAGTIPPRWQATIHALSERYDLAPAMIEAVIWQESRWHADAVSPRGARGLAQLMPQTARALGANPDDPVANVAAGAHYLHMLITHFGGNLELALAAYNAGPGRVDRAGRVPAIAETRRYVAAIMDRLAAGTRDRRAK